MKREAPRRTAAQVAEIIRTTEGAGPSSRTLQRHFARLGLNTRPDGSAPQSFGRFEAAQPGDLWTGDALHGPVIAGRKTYLFAFIDEIRGPSSDIAGTSSRTPCASRRRCAKGSVHVGSESRLRR